METPMLYMLRTLITLQLSNQDWFDLLTDHIVHDKEIGHALEALWEEGD